MALSSQYFGSVYEVGPFDKDIIGINETYIYDEENYAVKAIAGVNTEGNILAENVCIPLPRKCYQDKNVTGEKFKGRALKEVIHPQLRVIVRSGAGEKDIVGSVYGKIANEDQIVTKDISGSNDLFAEIKLDLPSIPFSSLTTEGNPEINVQIYWNGVYDFNVSVLILSCDSYSEENL